jgi:hypothetical protein
MEQFDEENIYHKNYIICMESRVFCVKTDVIGCYWTVDIPLISVI